MGIADILYSCNTYKHGATISFVYLLPVYELLLPYGKFTTENSVLSFRNVELTGDVAVSRHVARLSKSKTSYYGHSLLDAGEIDHWVSYANSNLALSGGLKSALARLNDVLSLRTFLVGETVSLADFMVWGALRSELAFMKV